jgi:oleandomycin transport system permease protein
MIATHTTRTRPTIAELVSDVAVLTGRNLWRLRSNPAQVAGMVAFPVIFVSMFTYVFGGAIGGSTAAYLQFALPGVLVQLMVMASQNTGQLLNEDVRKGVFDRFRSLPIGRSAPLIGQVLGSVIPNTMALVMTFAWGSVLGFRVHTDALHALAALGVLLLFAFCLNWTSIFVGLAAKNAAATQILEMAVMFPLTFVSNVFVPASTMPFWLATFVNFSPVSSAATILRGLLLGGSIGDSALKLAAWCAALVLVFFPLSLVFYRRRS